MLKNHKGKVAGVLALMLVIVVVSLHYIKAEAILPVATNVTIEGTPNVGETLNGSYNYVGGSWDSIGSNEFSVDPVYGQSLIFDNNDNLFVAYSGMCPNCVVPIGGNPVLGVADSVMKYVGLDGDDRGTGWETVGVPPNQEQIAFPSLAFDSSESLYFAYADYSGQGGGIGGGAGGPNPGGCGKDCGPGGQGSGGDGKVLVLKRGQPSSGIVTITPDAIPDAGYYAINMDSLYIHIEESYDASTSDIQTALDGALGVGNVIVTGSMLTSITLEFTGDFGNQPAPLVSVINSVHGLQDLRSGGNSVHISVDDIQIGTSGDWTPIGTRGLMQGFSDGAANYVSLAVNKNTDTPYVAYADAGDYNKATVQKYTNGKNEIQTITPDIIPDSGTYTISIEGYGTTDPINYDADSSTIQSALLAMFDNPEPGVNVTGDMTSSITLEFINDLANSIIPLATIDSSSLFNGETQVSPAVEETQVGVVDGWQSLGFPQGDEQDSGAKFTSLAIDSNGALYVAYASCNNGFSSCSSEQASSKITVMKYTEEDGWSAVGAPRFSDGQADDISLVIYNDIPYVAYSDMFDNGQATVMKYDSESDSWVPVGRPRFSDGQAGSISLKIDNNGELYIGYADFTVDNTFPQATVKKYNSENNTWESVGASRFSDDQAEYTALAIDSNNKLYVSYKDEMSTGKLTVKGYTADPESGSTYRWIKNIGTDSEEVVGTSKSYIPTSIDQGATLTFEVTPVSTSEITGDPVQSDPITVNSFPIASNVTISGTPSVGQSLTGNYTYGDIDKAWQTVGAPGISEVGATWGSVVIGQGGTPYVAYSDSTNDAKATVMKYDGENWIPVGTPGFSDSGANSPSLFISGGIPYIAYGDYADNYKATVMKFTGITEENPTGWMTVGLPRFSESQAWYVSLNFYNGVPYVAYEDGANGNAVTVMKFTGITEENPTGWVFVGTPDFSDADVDFISLSMDSNGTPYVAYDDGANGNAATVMKFTGITNENLSGWTAVGQKAFSDGGIMYSSLFIYNDIPYVAYEDLANSYAVTVMKFTGITEENPTGWEVVGTKGFSGSQADFVRISIDSNGNPYVAYGTPFLENGHRIAVRKYNGENWILVGTPELMPEGQADYTSLALSSSGVPYVSFSDEGNNSKITVMKFNQQSDLEGSSILRWYRDGTAISGATNRTYTITKTDAGKTLTFGVTPVAQSGSTPGEEVISAGVQILQVGGGSSGSKPMLDKIITSTGNTTTTVGSINSKCNLTKTLKYKVSDPEVKCLQHILNQSADTQLSNFVKGNGSSGNETNFFGNFTLLSVKKFQTRYRLTSDGIVGLKTRTKLLEIQK